MSDKKRNNKKSNVKRYSKKPIQTFDDTLNIIMAETIASTVRADKDDDIQIYHPHKSKNRYEQDTYTVAQNTVDRIEFRH